MSQEKLDHLADSIGVPHHDAKEKGYLNHKPLVWENEPARHKLLDIIGDIALIGKRIQGTSPHFMFSSARRNLFAM